MVDRIGLISERSKQEARSGIKAVIYPESILGDWTDSYNKPWKWEIASVAKSQGIQIAIGANRQIGKDLWDNTLTLQKRRVNNCYWRASDYSGFNVPTMA
ncbi:hypothetical protein ACFS07_33135 [Undibacterium arcticum]